jgi:hypothetical protein
MFLMRSVQNKTVDVSYEISTKQNTLCGQNVEVLKLNLVVRKVTTERSENYEVSKSPLELPDNSIKIRVFLFYFEIFNTTGKRRLVGGKCSFYL